MLQLPIQGGEFMNIQDDWEMKVSSSSLNKLKESETKLVYE
jgi:hypothetical protein